MSILQFCEHHESRLYFGYRYSIYKSFPFIYPQEIVSRSMLSLFLNPRLQIRFRCVHLHHTLIRQISFSDLDLLNVTTTIQQVTSSDDSDGLSIVKRIGTFAMRPYSSSTSGRVEVAVGPVEMNLACSTLLKARSLTLLSHLFIAGYSHCRMSRLQIDWVCCAYTICSSGASHTAI